MTFVNKRTESNRRAVTASSQFKAGCEMRDELARQAEAFGLKKQSKRRAK